MISCIKKTMYFFQFIIYYATMFKIRHQMTFSQEIIEIFKDLINFKICVKQETCTIIYSSTFAIFLFGVLSQIATIALYSKCQSYTMKYTF